MKKLRMIIPLVILLCFWTFLLESAPLHAKEWTSEQKEIVNWFKKYVEICFEGGADKVMSFFHPKYCEWDYRQEAPIGFDEKKTQEEYFYEQKYKVTTFDVEPLKILIQGNFAIVHLNFKLSYKDPEGKEITESGPWTAVLIKQDGKWFYLSNIWTVK